MHREQRIDRLGCGITKPNLGLLACLAAKSIYGHQVVVKESTTFICRVPSKEYRQLMLKRPELPGGFQGRVLKANLR